MSRFVKIAVVVLLLAAAIGIIAYSSSTPYANQDMRGILSRLPLSWLEQTFIGQISFVYGGRPVGIAYTGVEAFVEFFLRKGAHFVSFFVIGALACRLFAYIFRLRFASFFALLFVIGYASFDEYRQSLVPDRTPLLEDVLLDTAGGITGILLVVIWLSVRKMRQNRTLPPASQEPRTRMERRQRQRA
ncbi:hypothetical protein CHH61_18060 [Shouchella clausii]|uniref:VanZ-like domain-containing protein n=1 Tax=Shouchella clausii TaxID=79880 RepID=A0A268RWB5_SHOCL|nr:VanZ family protein [Shouchella clausii]PAF24565.1 hypothetical protein CHH61_18060 [Shouchella clausii]